MAVDRGRLVATYASNSAIHEHDPLNRGLPLRRFRGQWRGVFAIAWLGEDLNAKGGDNWAIVIWNANLGEERYRIDTETGSITSIIALDTAHFLVGTVDGTLILYGHEEGSSASELRRKPNANSGRIWEIGRSDGYAVNVIEDLSCALWQVSNALRCLVRWLNRNTVTAAATNSCYIVTASFDTLRVRRY